MKKHIIFDWNGTLVDDCEFSLNIENRLFKERGLREISLEEYKDSFCFPVRNYYVKIGFDFSKYSYDELATSFVEYYTTHFLECDLMEHAMDLLDELKNRNIQCTILSASLEENLIEQVKAFQIDSYFDDLVGINTIHATSKIQRAKEWMAQKDINPDDCLFIGDSTHDSQTALEIGVDCILLSKGHQSRRVLEETNRPVIDDLMELLTFI